MPLPLSRGFPVWPLLRRSAGGTALHSRLRGVPTYSSVKRTKSQTEIEILQLPTEGGQPSTTGRLRSEGRFLAVREEFLDPASMPPGIPVTVIGVVKGSTTRPLDDSEYVYPILDINTSPIGARSPHNNQETTLLHSTARTTRRFDIGGGRTDFLLILGGPPPFTASHGGHRHRLLGTISRRNLGNDNDLEGCDGRLRLMPQSRVSSVRCPSA